MEIFRRRNRGFIQNIHIESDVDGLDSGIVSAKVMEEGGELFEDFLSAQLVKDLPQLSPPSIWTPFQSKKKAELDEASAKLRQLAASFAQTEERRQIHEMAMMVSPDISGHDLVTLLLSTVTDNEHVTESIVVAFFFCFDLAARWLTSSLGCYGDVVTLCKTALLQTLGPRVETHGGWTQAIDAASINSMVTGAIVTGMLILARAGFKAIFNL